MALRRRRTTASRGAPVIPPWLQVQGDDLRLMVLVAPRASRNRIMGIFDNRLKIQLTAPPVDGKANDCLIRFLSESLSVAKAQIEIVGGASSRRKTVRLANVKLHTAIIKLTPPSG